MHCRACDCLLTDKESSMKSSSTGEYFDMCIDCLAEVPAELKITLNPFASDHILNKKEKAVK